MIKFVGKYLFMKIFLDTKVQIQSNQNSNVFKQKKNKKRYLVQFSKSKLKQQTPGPPSHGGVFPSFLGVKLDFPLLHVLVATLHGILGRLVNSHGSAVQQTFGRVV